MKTRKLKNIDPFELSLVFLPYSPVVSAARPLIIKGTVPFLETEEAKSILRQVAGVVEQLKAEQAAKELAQALAKEAQAQRPQRIRTRVYDNYEQYENSAAQARRRTARETFYAECLETARHNRNKQSDFGK